MPARAAPSLHRMSVPLAPRSIGVSIRTDSMAIDEAERVASMVERLGFASLWLVEALGRDPFVHASQLLAATDTLVVGTGVANIHLRSALATAMAAGTLVEQSGGRFALGLGMSHAELVEEVLELPYRSPLRTLSDYVAAVRAVPAAAELPIVLGVLGPKLSALGGAEADGVLPVKVSPEHVARTRALIGDDAWLGVKQYVMVETDPSVARAVARRRLEGSLGMANYARAFRAAGFEESDLLDGGSDRLVDMVVAWGPPAAIEHRVAEQLEAGADHVVLEPLDPREPHETDTTSLPALADAVGGGSPPRR